MTLKITSFLPTLHFVAPKEEGFFPYFVYLSLTEMVHTINSGREEVQLHTEI